jgi:methyl-accepting chemotaxis protein
MFLSQIKDFYSKLKISRKLIISSAVFLIPIVMMLISVFPVTIVLMQKSADERDGLLALKPVVTVMQNLPAYFNVYLGTEQGDARYLDEQITGALKSFDKEMKRYQPDGARLPDLLPEWEGIKKIGRDIDRLSEASQQFINSLMAGIRRIGLGSRLILASDMNTHYFVSQALTSIPQASTQLIATAELFRTNLHNAEGVITQWNRDLVIAQAQGARLGLRQYQGDPKNITWNMIGSANTQLVRNFYHSIITGSEQIKAGLELAVSEGQGYNKYTGEFEELTKKLAWYQEKAAAAAAQYERMRGMNQTNPLPLAACLDAMTELNTALGQLWGVVLGDLDAIIQYKSTITQRNLILYLLVILLSLGFAFSLVIYITLDINRSVKILKTLLKGLSENDLTLTLQINSKDEFGELMTAFNGFLTILRSTFGSFKQSAKLVSNSVFDISSSSKEITTTANEQSASVSEIVSTMESSKNLSEQIALKTTEVAHLATEAQDLSSKGAELREANQTMMEDIRKQNQKIISEIRNLSDMIIRISEAIRIIDSIADQTKLIAFNASLEASSSGEAGARFAVVASEIRRFADNVAESTREIKQKIEEVQGASQTLIAEASSGSRQIEIGYERMSEQKVVFENIVNNSQSVAIRSQQISNLSKQQELASSQIFIALKEISTGAKQFVIATSSTSKIADSLNTMSEDLTEKVEKYRTEN